MSEPRPFRHVEGEGWQVLGDGSPTWIQCKSQQDAELLASFEPLCHDVFGGRTSGEEVAARLDAMAAAFLRNLGQGLGYRFILQAANKARGIETP